MPDQLREDVSTGIKSGPFEWLTKTANYSVDVGERAFRVSGTFTLTLQAMTADLPESIIVKQTGAGTVTIATADSATIDGDATFDLIGEDEAVQLFPDTVNTDWSIA